MTFSRLFLIHVFAVLAPVLLLVAINLEHPTITDTTRYEHRCSMACFYSTAFCKEHHTHILTPYFKYTDKAYFGVINFLNAGGDYEKANIIYLVAGWPLLMYILLSYSATLQLIITRKK